MRLLEYQTKEIFAAYGIPVPEHVLVKHPDDIEAAISTLGEKAVVKAQVAMGGRGKAGGIKIGNTAQELKEQAGKLLGGQLKEFTIGALLIEELLDIQSEFYLSVVTDSQQKLPVVILSTRGGIDIEQVAEQTPDEIHKVTVDPLYGLQPYEIGNLLSAANIPSSLHKPLRSIIQNLYQVYWEKDSQLVEINPLVVTTSGGLFAADGKMLVDDNALFRQTEIANNRVLQPYEKVAEEAHINYIPLSGDIGMMGTGAGMAMANLDQVAHFGGSPANFMDVGPAINIHGVRAGMELLLERKDLKAILISGYTGSRLDIFAQDVVDTLNDHPGTAIPIVIRLQGRNEEIGHKIFRENPFDNLHFCDDFDRAAEMAVQLSRGETI